MCSQSTILFLLLLVCLFDVVTCRHSMCVKDIDSFVDKLLWVCKKSVGESVCLQKDLLSPSGSEMHTDVVFMVILFSNPTQLSGFFVLHTKGSIMTSSAFKLPGSFQFQHGIRGSQKNMTYSSLRSTLKTGVEAACTIHRIKRKIDPTVFGVKKEVVLSFTKCDETKTMYDGIIIEPMFARSSIDISEIWISMTNFILTPGQSDGSVIYYSEFARLECTSRCRSEIAYSSDKARTINGFNSELLKMRICRPNGKCKSDADYKPAIAIIESAQIDDSGDYTCTTSVADNLTLVKLPITVRVNPRRKDITFLGDPCDFTMAKRLPEFKFSTSSAYPPPQHFCRMLSIVHDAAGMPSNYSINLLPNIATPSENGSRVSRWFVEEESHPVYTNYTIICDAWALKPNKKATKSRHSTKSSVRYSYAISNTKTLSCVSRLKSESIQIDLNFVIVMLTLLTGIAIPAGAVIFYVRRRIAVDSAMDAQR